MRTRRRRWWWAAAGVLVLAAPVAWYLGSPLFISRTVDEAFPMSAEATGPEGMTRAEVEATMAAAAGMEGEVAEVMPSGAVALARGTFAGADDFHRGEGTATVYRVGTERVLRFEAFRVTNGPDLHVILTRHPAPRSRADVQEGYQELGGLKGNIGSQNYPLPADLDLEAYPTIVIYCKPFHVVFATAPLRPEGR